MGERQKIVILGGGVGALTAAYYLSDTPEKRALYDVTVYQLGWRLGGKGASGRNRDRYDRIEEHGLHIWFGFYVNAFQLMQRCYKALKRPAGTPLATWDEAFKPHMLVAFPEPSGEGWDFGLMATKPNSVSLEEEQPAGFPTIWAGVQNLLSQTHTLLAQLPKELRELPAGPPAALWDLRYWWNHLFGARVPEESVAASEPLHVLFERAHELACAPAALDQPGDGPRLPLARLVERGRKQLQPHVEESGVHPPPVSRALTQIDLMLATVRGLIRDNVVAAPDGFDAIDDYDLREWLLKHGASKAAVESAYVRTIYDLVFGFRGGDPKRPSLAAGTALRGIIRLMFGYRQAHMWKMQAGMGDVVFAPLYLVLKENKVHFKFFHRVTDLQPSAAGDNGDTIEQIHLRRQAAPLRDEYCPLVDVDGLPCWPNEPVYDRLRDGEALRARRLDLESAWTDRTDEEPLTLVRGRDFDTVVLGISLGALPQVCAKLIAAKDSWRQMVRHVETVRTFGLQLWLKPDLASLGWLQEPPVLAGYVEPFDTWADMTHLLVREQWPPSDAPRTVAYFCGPLEDDPEQPGFEDATYPRRQRVLFGGRAVEFLEQHIGALWPNALRPETSGFNWSLLHGLTGAGDPPHLDAQYVRVNCEPSERYVLSVPGSSKFRLHAGNSGYDNLVLAGDWTKNGLNAGCVEAAVMSGMQAALAIQGRVEPVFGETDFP